MTVKKNIFVIVGSAGRNSANEKLIDHLAQLAKDDFNLAVYKDLKTLPHFDPELSASHPPEKIVAFRKNIEEADGVIICTPEYVFSIPAGLKNAMEWCVSTTVFSDKPVGLITASASGQKGHEELQLIMRTLMAKFSDKTTLLIQGIKGKINGQGQISDDKTKERLVAFINGFRTMLS
jgi:chromate reductase, NAD(P)H dehydrogenase (quinone)